MTNILKTSVEELIKQQEVDFERIQKIVENEIHFDSVLIDNKIDLSKFKKKKVLYYFTIEGNSVTSKVVCRKITEAKTEAKEQKLNLFLPKVNIENAINNNKILYVGKSFNDFSSRLKQHLGQASEKVYALHLNKWGNYGIKNIKLKLHYFSFNSPLLKDNEDHLLELLETSLHYKFKPILGRTGH